MSRWYLVRHGRTAWNAEGRVQGHTDTPLGEGGLAQAQRTARRLATVKFAAVYSSDLARALTTAQTIVAGHDLPIRTTPLLREANHGAWDGLTYDEVKARDPQRWQSILKRDEDVAAPGGENMAGVLERVKSARDMIVAGHTLDHDVLIVAHSGSIRALFVALLELPVTAAGRIRVDPASVSIVAVHERGATLDLWNDTSHLEPEQ
ncbi:MAG: histidine phosphatase family protein [Chloroflexi bacterium]|nr:histidine phosphatase family protein [Chloroflexota bacterium]